VRDELDAARARSLGILADRDIDAIIAAFIADDLAGQKTMLPAGATETIVVDPIAAKRTLALELGASAAFDPAGDVVFRAGDPVDGGCTGVSQVKSGIISATSQQYPSKMASLGMEAIVKLAKTGQKAKTTNGLDFFNTGSQLVTNTAVPGLKSITPDAASSICWGK